MPVNRKPLNAVTLTEEQTRQLKSEIAAFFLEERDEEIGLIQQQEILDFFLRRLAPVVYNRALYDAEEWFKHALGGVEADYYALYKDER